MIAKGGRPRKARPPGERMAARVGPERLLFGTGMPMYAPGPAITLLTYSGLSQAEKSLVGAGNLRRLLDSAGG